MNPGRSSLLPLRVAALIAVIVALPASAQDASTVRLLAANCANCHGTDGRSQGGMPSLNGQSKATLVEAMQEFRSGKRVATVMQQLSRGYTDAEIELLAGFFSAQR